MAYWIQETGGNGQNRSDWRMYHCDYRKDIKNLPLNDKNGIQQGSDTVGCKKAHFGDQCFCLEDGSVWELRNEPNDWKELGV